MSDFMIEMMQHDFNVEVIAQKENAHLMLGIRGSHYHFVESIQDGSFNTMDQHHIPRFQMAYWFDSLSRNKDVTSVRPLSANISPSFRLTLSADDQVGFSSVVDYILKEKDSEKFFKAVKKDIARLRKAKKLIKTKGKKFYLDGIKTMSGRRIESGLLDYEDLQIIAFDYLLLDTLRKKPVFGIYIMYSHLIDNNTDFPNEEFDKMALRLASIRTEDMSHGVSLLFTDVQKKFFSKQIWGKGVKIPTEDVSILLREFYTNLNPYQKIEFKILHVLHRTVILLLIGFIFQSITLSKYIELNTQSEQPDSEREQRIRYESNVIQMFIDKFFNKK